MCSRSDAANEPRLSSAPPISDGARVGGPRPEDVLGPWRRARPTHIRERRLVALPNSFEDSQATARMRAIRVR